MSTQSATSMTHPLARRRGFTLVEILLATSLMTVVIMLVVSILGTVMNAWGRANTALEQNSEAALILDTIGRDFSGAVIRTDGKQSWFKHTRVSVGGIAYSNLVFLSSPTDRGRVKTGTDPVLLPGNISTLAYSVLNINPVKPTLAENTVNVICRYLTPPEKTYSGALADFKAATWETVRSSMGSPAEADSKSLLASNIYAFDLAYAYRDTTGKLIVVPSKNITTVEFPYVEKSGQTIVAPEYFEVTLTVLSDTGAQKLENIRANNSTENAETVIAQESRQFSRRYFMPSKGLTLNGLKTK